MKKERKYGLSAIVFGLLLSVFAWIPFIFVEATLYSELSIGEALATFCTFLLFSPAVILFYVSFALLADEVFGYLTGRAVFGIHPGSLKGKIRQILGSEDDGAVGPGSGGGS